MAETSFPKSSIKVLLLENIHLIMDLEQDVSQDVKKAISELPTSIKTRILF